MQFVKTNSKMHLQYLKKRKIKNREKRYTGMKEYIRVRRVKD